MAKKTNEQLKSLQQSGLLTCSMSGKGFCPYEEKDGKCKMVRTNCTNHMVSVPNFSI